MNFDVNFKLNRTIYIPEVKDEAEAKKKALDHMLNLFNQDLKEFIEIEIVKVGE